MPREREPDVLGPLEAEVMAVGWTVQTPLTVRQVLDRLNESRSTPLAYAASASAPPRGRGMKVDTANRAFIAMVAVALAPYIALGLFGCELLSYLTYRAARSAAVV